MSAPHTGAWRRHFVGAWMLAILCTTISEAATIAGVVRDVHDNPLDGARIRMICELSPQKTAEVTSGKDGSYRFTELPPGKCQLLAERTGFRVATPVVVTISSASASVVADFTLSNLSQEEETTPQPRLKFEAAGVRGLIDPGGYSAPANAAAASGLISGIADIRRTENGSGSLSALKELPCKLEPELTKAVTANPLNGDANRRLGEFYLAHGSVSRAIPYLQRARQIDSGDSRTVRDLSEAQLINGQFDAAHELLTRQPASQRDADFYRLLARAEEGLGQFTQASVEYEIAAQKDPNEDNSFGIGYELILAGRPEVAAKAFNSGVARYPSSMTLLLGAGTAEFLQGRSSAALKMFLQAADSNPSDPRPYPFLAEAFEISGAQGEEVRASLKRHLELLPDDAEAHYLYALSLLHGNANGGVIDTGRVESLLKQAIVLDPSFAKAHFQLGTFYAHRDDYENAAREFEVAVRLAPDMKEAHYRLAAAYKRMGRAESAEHEMKLFREAQESMKNQNGEDGISVDQFISVVNRPGHALANNTECSRNPE